MIFKPEMVEKILAGEKTVTRRPVKWEDTGFEVRNLPCRYEVGKDYAVQPGRGKKAVGRIRIMSVWRETIGALTPDEARREGFAVPFDFIAYWMSLYSLRSFDECFAQLVDRIEFELLSESPVKEGAR